ncbi:dirigent protein 21-like [Typha latifolia]|uniref:dirigent protein 21-like n=1 Tax=Typha latifolia TaxID=4733 RepID=UPI003C2E1056
MSILLSTSTSTSTSLLLLLLLSSTISTATQKPIPRAMKEMQSHLHFYWHDIVAGPSPTAIRVAEAPSSNKSAASFGVVVTMDDPMTAGPEPSSKLLGRAQGLYAFVGKDKLALLVAMNLAFMDGKYNDSTITILGRNEVVTPVREMPVIGGSGLFRLARGYALAKTYYFNTTTGDTVVEYDVYVMHY